MNFQQYRKRLQKMIVRLLAGAVVSVMFCPSSMAQQKGDTKSFMFSGVMVEVTACTINGDRPLLVTFGNVGISKIDSGKYVQDLNYSLECGGATSANRVFLFIRATPTTWDEKAIATSVDGLGAEILMNGSPLDLNRNVEISDPANPPALKVQLVKDPATSLTEQTFTATGTLVAEYI